MAIRWTQQEISNLTQLYETTPTKELIKIFSKSKDSITHKAKALNLSKDIHWTDADDKCLREMYTTHDTESLMNHFNRSYDSIIQRASTLKIKKGFDFHRHSDISILLNDSLTTLYWIGFLLADGTFPASNGTPTSRMSLIIGEKDAGHLQKFADYIQLTRPIKRREYPTNKVAKFVGYEVTVGDSERLPLLCKRYGIVSNKTYNPPDFSTYNLSIEQWLALLVGLIDGDGYISSKVIRVRVKCHSSWQDALQILSDKTTEWGSVKHVRVYAKENYCMLTLGKRILIPLHRFALDNNLPILLRKWDVL